MEYKIQDIEYTPEDKQRIDEYNKTHVRLALNMLKQNREKIMRETHNGVNPASTLQARVEYFHGLEEFKEFCRTYPIVTKFIVAYGLFSTKAFIKYMDWKAKVRPTDETRAKLVGNQREQEKFKNRYIYAIYVKFLYKEKGNHSSTQQLEEMYETVVQDLNKDVDEFFDKYEESVKEVEGIEQDNIEYRKKKLLEQVQKKYA